MAGHAVLEKVGGCVYGWKSGREQCVFVGAGKEEAIEETVASQEKTDRKRRRERRRGRRRREREREKREYK